MRASWQRLRCPALDDEIEILAIEGSIESRENMRKIIEKILDIWYDVM